MLKKKSFLKVFFLGVKVEFFGTFFTPKNQLSFCNVKKSTLF